MKYLGYLALCILMPLLSQAQSSSDPLEGIDKNHKENTFTSSDSLFARNFALCFLKDSIRLQKNEIVYFEAVRQEDRFVLSVLKGTHSKEVYTKLIDALECAELGEHILMDEVRFILYNEKISLREIETSKRRVKEFRLKYSIPSEVEVIKTVFGRTIR